jgi:hypothetical protein
VFKGTGKTKFEYTFQILYIYIYIFNLFERFFSLFDLTYFDALENLIRAYLVQIALETILLHLQTDLNGIARTFF